MHFKAALRLFRLFIIPEGQHWVKVPNFTKNRNMKQFAYFMILICLGLSANGLSQNFTPAERQLILSGDTANMMRVLQYNNPADLLILNTPSADIDPSDPLLPLLASRMFKSMLDSANPGVGISAPQVGINRNAFWIQRFDKSGVHYEFCMNPRILKYSILHRKGGEGCLSMPGERGLVYRSYAIQVEYLTLNGETKNEMLDDNTAVVFQHEADHLLGWLFPDRMREQQGIFFMQIPQGMEFYIRPGFNK